jgi:hypothetical protein
VREGSERGPFVGLTVAAARTTRSIFGLAPLSRGVPLCCSNGLSALLPRALGLLDRGGAACQRVYDRCSMTSVRFGLKMTHKRH